MIIGGFVYAMPGTVYTIPGTVYRQLLSIIAKLIFSAFDKNAEEDFTHRNERDFSIDYLKISVVWYYSNLNQQKISFVAVKIVFPRFSQ